MMSLGSSTRARAIEMRWHWPPENWCGRRSAATSGSRPTSSSTWRTLAIRSALVPDLPDVQRLEHDVPHLAPRVQRRDGVLEDHLDVRAHGAHVVTVERRELLTLERDGSTRRSRELHDRPAGRRLAAAGLAHDAERLAGEDVEADAGDGVDLEAGPADGELRRPGSPRAAARRRHAFRWAVPGPGHQLAPPGEDAGVSLGLGRHGVSGVQPPRRCPSRPAPHRPARPPRPRPG